jgi:TP901 family phage tail tape measure protein
VSYTFQFDVDEKSLSKIEKLASSVERVGESASKTEVKLAEAFDGAVLKGAADSYRQLAEAQGKWAMISSRAAPTAKDLVDSMKKYHKALVDSTNDIDRATAADKAHIEINRHKIKETLRYEVALRKLRISERAFNEQQERDLVLTKRRVELKKKLAATNAELNPSRTVKSLVAANAVADESLKIRTELLQLSARETALSNQKIADQSKEVEFKKIVLSQQREELKAQAKLQAAKQGVISLTNLESRALRLVQKEHISYAAAMKRVTEEAKRLNVQQKVNEDQQHRLAVAQAKNSAGYLKTEKVIAELESRYRRATQTITHFNAVQSKGGIIVSTFRNVMDAMGRHIAVYTAGMVGVAAAVYGTTRAVRAGFDSFNSYTEAMARVEAVSGATAGQMQKMEEEARRLGRTTRFSAVEAAEGLVQLTMAGLSAKEATLALAPTLTLASIGTMQFGEAADIVTNIMRGFALQATDLPHVIDVMATSVTSSNMTVQQLGNAMSYVAPVAESFGVSVEEVAASMEVLHNSGIKASRAGTGMRKTLLSLYAPTNKATEALERMGVSTITMSGKAKPLIVILNEMNKKFAEGKATIADFKEIVGVRASNSFLQLIKAADGSSESLAALIERLKTATGAAAGMRETIEDFIGADWEKLKDALIDIGIGLLELYEIPLRAWIKGVTASISELAGSEESIRAIADGMREFGEKVLFVGKAFLAYKLVQTVYLLGVNAIETAKYLSTMGTRLLESAGLVKGWSAAVISGNQQVAMASAETSVIVDAAGKKMVASNTASAASAVLMGKTYTGVLAKVILAAKWFGKFALGAGLVGAAIWAVSEAMSWLFSSLTDTTDELGNTVSAFDGLSSSVESAKEELSSYQRNAERLLGGSALAGEIDAVSRALEGKEKALRGLRGEQAQYNQLVKRAEELKSRELSLAGKEDAVSRERLKLIRAQMRQVQQMLDKSRESKDTLQEAFKSDSLQILEAQIKQVTKQLDRYERKLDSIKAKSETSFQIPGAVNQLNSLYESAKGKLLGLITLRDALLKRTQEGSSDTQVGQDLISRAEEAREQMQKIIAEVNSGGASAASELQNIVAGLSALADGKLPAGISTTNAAITWLNDSMKNLRSTAEAARSESEKQVKSNQRHEEAMRKLADEQTRLTEVKSKDVPVSVRYAAVQDTLKKTLAEIEKIEKIRLSGGKLTETQKKRLEALAKKYNLTLKDEEAIMKELAKSESAHNRELKSLQEEVAPATKMVGEYAKKVALLKELLDQGSISQEEMNRYIREYTQDLKEAAAATDFEKKLVEYEDLIGNLDKASSGWVDSFTDGLANLIRTGKADFSGFIDSILNDLAKLAAQQIVISIVGDIKGMTGGEGLFGSLGQGALSAFSGNQQTGGMFGGLLNAGTGVFGGSLVAGAGSLIGSLGGTIGGGFGSFLGGVGSGLIGAGGGAAGATASAGLAAGGTAGIGMTIGAVIPWIGAALAVLAAIGAFDDQEAESRFKLQPGKQPDWTNTKRPWEKTDFGAIQHGKQGELMGVVVDSVFGSMGASGQHFGKDEQLSDADLEKYINAMKDLFIQLATIDEAIVEAYDLSDEAVDRIKEAANGMDDVVKKWKTPDLGAYVVERYNYVFKEIGGTVEKIFHDMSQSGLNAEDSIRAVTAAFTFDSILLGLETVTEDADAIMEQSAMTQLERLQEQRDIVLELSEAYDGSISSVEELNQALDAQRQGTLALLIEIEKIRDAMTSAFAGTREKIETSLMDDSQKYTYYQDQLDFWAGILANATDPAQINEAQGKINEFVNKLWDIQLAAGPGAAGQTQQEWLEYLAEQENVANQQLDAAAEAAANQAQELHDQIKSAIDDAVIPMKEAADTSKDASDTLNDAANIFLEASGLIDSASQSFSYAASEIAGTTITVDLIGNGSAVGV